MNQRLKLLYIFLLFLGFISAQSNEITSFQIAWKGVDTWRNDSSTRSVISFEGAKYPTENYLPQFSRIIKDASLQTTNLTLENVKYEPVTLSQELEILADIALLTEPKLNIIPLYEGGSSSLEVQVLPFVRREGRYLKISSFDLVSSKTAILSKRAKANTSELHSYVSSSVLSQGKFVKIKIKNTGIYKLTYEDLQSMGINPASVRVYGYGGGVLDQSFLLPKIDDLPQLAIWMEKGADGVFNAGDYILFHAQGIIKWSFDTYRSLFTHQINPYSSYGYYFVTSDVGSEKLISSQASIVPPEDATISEISTFLDYDVFEEDLVNLTSSGKEFYGYTFNAVNYKNIAMRFGSPVIAENSITAALDVAARSPYVSSFTLTLDDAQSKSLSVAKRNPSDNYEQAKAGSGIYNFTPNSSNLNFKIVYNKPDASSVGYLNYLEINANRYLIMSGSEMKFSNSANFGSGVYNHYHLTGAGANVQVWDITDKSNITRVAAERNGTELSFYGITYSVKEYLAIDPTASSAFPKPEIGEIVPNQNLHALAPVDMVILTHPDFVAQAEVLANAHREKDYLTVEVVTTEQVYNEFSSGTPDATAYRWLMKMLYDRALTDGNTSDIPKYLLLFGRGSYDNRGIMNDSGDSFVLTYQAENSLVTTMSYVTDDYFTFLDDYEGANVPSHLMDISVGRFTVTNAKEATDMVNKTVEYMKNNEKGKWKNQLLFLADDGDSGLHMTQSDSIASYLGRTYPAYEIKKVFLDAYIQESSASGESYPLVTATIHNLLQQGVFLFNYTGHAGAAGFANEAVLTVNEVNKMSNKHLPLWVGATCDFLQYDVQTISAGESVVLNPSGGGIGIFSAARPVYAAQNAILNKYFCDFLLSKPNGEHLRVGDAIRKAKNNVGTEINKLSYVLVGDPALRLNYPTQYRVVTSKINESTTLGTDTLRALSVASIGGYIVDGDGNKVSDFNGTINSTIYDKVQLITTLDNDKNLYDEDPIIWASKKFKYKDRPNMLFSGQTTVTDGEFSFSFLLPKDIKYNFGSGKINYYAQDEDPLKNAEAQGAFDNFTVGGTSSDFVNETDGPAVELCLNTLNFVNGDKVNEEPLFIAKVNDVNGINIVGSGIGHDVMLTIDNDSRQSYQLNNSFTADLNSYTKGTFTYKLPLMQDGKHTLSFKVWDLLNNSSTASLDFEVVTGLTPQMLSVINYPNPASTYTQIVVVHDRPETVLTTTVEIVDLSGRVLWNFTQASADKITWDLIGGDGQRVKPGIYLYRVNVKTVNSDVCSRTCKMIITN